MKTIFYGINGEGLGHVTRSLAVINSLDNVHVEVFTYGDAYNFLLNQQYPFLNKIEGINFHYKDGKVHPLLSINNFIQFLYKAKNSLKQIVKKAKELNPSLFITDFEPLIPRIAKTLKRNYISIDNQHKFQKCKFKIKSLSLKLYIQMASLFTKFFIPNPNQCIISTFHYDITPKIDNKTTLVGPLLSKDLVQLSPSDMDFTLIYCKPTIEFILKKIKLDHKIKVYGAKNRDIPGIEYYDLSRNGFLKDLASCSRLITTSGNQLIGEARYLGKPCLVIPIPNQHEQEVNALFAKQLGNVFCNIENMTEDLLEHFIKNYKTTLKKEEINGLPKTLETILEFLKTD